MIPHQRLPASLTPLDVGARRRCCTGSSRWRRSNCRWREALRLHRRRHAAARGASRRTTSPPPTAGRCAPAISSARPPIRRCRWRQRRSGSKPATPCPRGCDCVLDSDSVDQSGPDGAGAGGSDPGAGRSPRRRRYRRGTAVSSRPGGASLARDLLIARAAGLKQLKVRRPRLRIVNIPAAAR